MVLVGGSFDIPSHKALRIQFSPRYPAFGPRLPRLTPQILVVQQMATRLRQAKRKTGRHRSSHQTAYRRLAATSGFKTSTRPLAIHQGGILGATWNSSHHLIYSPRSGGLHQKPLWPCGIHGKIRRRHATMSATFETFTFPGERSTTTFSTSIRELLPPLLDIRLS